MTSLKRPRLSSVLVVGLIVIAFGVIISLPLNTVSTGRIPVVQLSGGWQVANDRCGDQKNCIQGGLCVGLPYDDPTDVSRTGFPFATQRDASPACALENNNLAKILNPLSILALIGALTLIDKKFFFVKKGAAA